MERIVKKIGNAEFTFWLNSRNNRSGFVHECELYMENECLAKEKMQYYNRTWECYRFQSVMLGAVQNAIDYAKQKMIDNAKAEHGWQKLTAERRKIMEQEFEQNGGLKTLEELYNAVNTAKYGTEEEKHELQMLDCMLAVLELLKA